MIDCHCHLADEQFANDIGDVIERAKHNGVVATVVCAEFSDQFDSIIQLADRFKAFCFPAIGIHPVQRNNHSVTMGDVATLDDFVKSKNDMIVAIGEVGLDFTPRFMNRLGAKEDQIAVFKYQIQIAKKLGLPLNVHSRSAGKPVIEVLRECNAEQVLLHAFSGNPKNAQPAIDSGYYFSIPPSFSLSEQKISLIERIPMSQLCLETDSPVLGPIRNERNEPMNIGMSASFIAKIKQLSIEEVIQTTTENALKLFPKLKAVIGK